jgi:CHAT domain-containing protein
MFDVYAKTPTLGRAEVLRRAQLALLARAETSHPFFWAAFTPIGDGGGSGTTP